jgi:hypothetical protein
VGGRQGDEKSSVRRLLGFLCSVFLPRLFANRVSVVVGPRGAARAVRGVAGVVGLLIH